LELLVRAQPRIHKGVGKSKLLAHPSSLSSQMTESPNHPASKRNFAEESLRGEGYSTVQQHRTGEGLALPPHPAEVVEIHALPSAAGGARGATTGAARCASLHISRFMTQ